MPSIEPSPRPWRVEYDGVTNRIEVIDAEGRPVCGWSAFNPYEADHHADANLIVAAVNERDRLRDLVRRLVRVAIRDRETLRYIYSDVEYATEDDDAIGDALREARAAIGEDAPSAPCAHAPSVVSSSQNNEKP